MDFLELLPKAIDQKSAACFGASLAGIMISPELTAFAQFLAYTATATVGFVGVIHTSMKIWQMIKDKTKRED